MKSFIIAKIYSLALAIAIIISAILSACDDSSTAPSLPTIKTGSEVKLIEQEIGNSGGNIVVQNAADSLNGLRLSIPAQSYTESRAFRISYAPITEHSFGQYFHPISPLIRISNGGGYADSLMTLSIPVHVPAGHFAMAFMYNATTGSLEGLPLAESTPDHITVFTKHFAQTSLTDLGKGVFVSGGDVDFSDIVVSSVDTAVLMQDFFTPFKPGVDDFQFTNWGSIVDRGHCSGQSIGMLWYYSQKKLKGSPQLFGRFDNDGVRKTPHLWQDDVQGYKFCGMTQLDWSYSLPNNILELWQGKNDQRTLYAFSYALRVTNEPQLVVIYPRDTSAPHAMVAYGITRGTLHIADPNYPGITERLIRYDEANKIYQAYFTGVNAGDVGKQYPTIHYLAKSSVASWSKAAEHWKNVANGSIGKGTFPDYTLVALNENDEFVSLADGFTVPLGGRLTLNVRGKGFVGDFEVFNTHEDILTKDGSSVQLPPGKNLIGVLIKDTAKRWVDFKWINVTVPGEATPGPTVGVVKLTLYSDGKKLDVDTATFRVTGSSETYYFLDINATIREQEHPYNTYLRLAVGVWRGGKHSSGLSPFTSISKYFSNTSYNLNLVDPNYGNIQIDEWGYRKLEGSFSFTGYSEDKSKSSNFAGEFHFLR